MATPSVISAEKITKKEFSKILKQYPDLLETISAAKGAKPGQRTLKQLDAFRYQGALKLFDIKNPQRCMGLEDLKTLVEWKLKHGKFRPTLMALVASNDDDDIQAKVKQALEAYADGDGPLGVKSLSMIKGVGPATASLVMSVHDPANVIFFSDEVFYWLCCNGQKGQIKYKLKEYDVLYEKAQILMKRLGVSATDIEKVAFVLFKQPEWTGSAGSSGPPNSSTKAEPKVKGESKVKTGSKAKAEAEEESNIESKIKPTPSKRKVKTRVRTEPEDEPEAEPKPKSAAAKRKAKAKQEPIDEDSSDKAPLRRSKRIRAS